MNAKTSLAVYSNDVSEKYSDLLPDTVYRATMSEPVVAVNLAQIDHPPPSMPTSDVPAEGVPPLDLQKAPCCQGKCQQPPSISSPLADEVNLEEEINGPDRGIFENMWQAVARWLQRPCAKAADELDGEWK